MIFLLIKNKNMFNALKKKFNSDNEILSDKSAYIKANKTSLNNKINNIPNPKDYPNSMKDRRLFEKYSIEYIKNILFKEYNCIFSENIPFNFLDYVKIFIGSNHSEQQTKIFQNIIALKNKKAQSEDYIYFGDFDMVIDSISGKNIINAMDKFKSNFYEYSGDLINNEDNYCIIGEIKRDFFEEIKKEEIKKQFYKYAEILKLLSTNPNLIQLKKRIGINENNKLIFAIVTDGNYNNFEYFRHIKKKFEEDIHTDNDINCYPNFLISLDILSTVIPVIVIFIPRILDDNKRIFASKGEKKC